MADITITEGDTLEVDYSLENTGDGTGTFDPHLLVQGVQEDQDTGITLNPAQTATGTLQWPTESGDAVTDALAEAVTDDTSDSITVTVESATPDSGVTQAQRYWPADDGSGSTIAEDRLGDDSTGFTGTWTSGSYIGGTAPVYDGANDWDEADYAFDATFQGFGFFVAIEPHSGGLGTERYFAEPSGGSGGNGWEPGPVGRVGTDDGLEFFTKDGTSTVTLQSSAISHDTLHTVGASYNPNNEAVLYLDGSRVDSASVGTPENNEPTTMNWGSDRDNGRTFDGVIDARLHLQGDYWTDTEHQEIHDQYMAII